MNADVPASPAAARKVPTGRQQLIAAIELRMAVRGDSIVARFKCDPFLFPIMEPGPAPESSPFYEIRFFVSWCLL